MNNFAVMGSSVSDRISLAVFSLLSLIPFSSKVSSLLILSQRERQAGLLLLESVTAERVLILSKLAINRERGKINNSEARQNAI